LIHKDSELSKGQIESNDLNSPLSSPLSSSVNQAAESAESTEPVEDPAIQMDRNTRNNQKSAAPKNEEPGPAATTSDSRPETAQDDKPATARPDPTRYGDWEKNGRCIDF